MSDSSNDAGASGAKKPVSTIICGTLLRAIAGSLIVEMIILIYTRWPNNRKRLP